MDLAIDDEVAVFVNFDRTDGGDSIGLELSCSRKNANAEIGWLWQGVHLNIKSPLNIYVDSFYRILELLQE